MDNHFLAINKDYFGKGLKSIDILILAQIEEFQRNKCQCYKTNKQFAEMFGESESTVKRSLNRLEEEKLIVRHTRTVEGNGRANKQRVLSLADNAIKEANRIKECKVQKTGMEGSISDDDRVKNSEWKGHNEPIKGNLKENIKNNLKDNKFREEFANTLRNGKTKNRTIVDLTLAEGDAISKAIRNNTAIYTELQRKYGLQFGSATKNFPKQWESERNRRGYLAEQERQKKYGNKEQRIDYSKIYVKPTSREEMEHEKMMERLLLEGLEEERNDEYFKKDSNSLKSELELGQQRPRMIGELSIEEGDAIAAEIREGKTRCEEIWKKYNVKPEVITENYLERWERCRKGIIRIAKLEENGLNMEDWYFNEEEGDEDMWDSADENEVPKSLKIIEEMKIMHKGNS